MRRSVAAVRSPRKAALALGIALALLSGCSSPRWKSHFEGEVWGGALASHVERPDRYVPEGFLLAAIPFAFLYDDEVSEHFADREENETAHDIANSLQYVVPAIPTLIGGAKWAGGDEGRNLEVTAEALVGSVAIQQLIARTVQRERPDENTQATSFPSGHTSSIFAATTLIVRNIHDPGDSTFHAIDTLLYLPAIFGAWDRVAISQHWLSDVAVGAFLGVFWTNLVWDLHYKGAGDPRPTVHGEGRRGVAWAPTLDVIDGNLAFGIRCGF